MATQNAYGSNAYGGGFYGARAYSGNAYPFNNVVSGTAYRSVDANVLAQTCNGILLEPLRENFHFNSIWENATSTTAPTNWTAPFATGIAEPASQFDVSSSMAVRFAGSSQRPFYSEANKAVTAGLTYCQSIIVRKVTNAGDATAEDIIAANTTPLGTTFEFPICEANPSGGSGGTVTEGELLVVYNITTTGTIGELRYGLGCQTGNTGDYILAAPQFEVGEIRTSTIESPIGSSAVRNEDLTTLPYTDGSASLPANDFQLVIQTIPHHFNPLVSLQRILNSFTDISNLFTVRGGATGGTEDELSVELKASGETNVLVDTLQTLNTEELNVISITKSSTTGLTVSVNGSADVTDANGTYNVPWNVAGINLASNSAGAAYLNQTMSNILFIDLNTSARLFEWKYPNSVIDTIEGLETTVVRNSPKVYEFCPLGVLATTTADTDIVTADTIQNTADGA